MEVTLCKGQGSGVTLSLKGGAKNRCSVILTTEELRATVQQSYFSTSLTFFTQSLTGTPKHPHTYMQEYVLYIHCLDVVSPKYQGHCSQFFKPAHRIPVIKATSARQAVKRLLKPLQVGGSWAPACVHAVV